MADELAWIVVAEGGVSVALALALLVGGLRSPSRWILAALIADYAAVALLTSIPILTHAPLAAFHLPRWIARIAFVSLHLAFAAVYPRWTLSPGRLVALVLSFVPAAFLIAFTLANPHLLPAPGASANWYQQTLELVIVTSHLPALWVFGRSWLKESGEFRGQFLYVLVAYLLWNLSFALERLTTSIKEPGTFGPFLLTLGYLFLMVQTLSVLIIGIAGLVHLASGNSKGSRGADARFVVWLFCAVPFVLFQFGHPLGPLIFQGAFVPLLFYGGAKYQLVRLPMQLKLGIRGGVLGGIGLAIVFLIEETVQYLIGRQFGYLSGLALAAVVMVTFSPVRRFAKRVSDGAMPSVEDSADYLAKRRLELYRVALEGMIRDQVIDPKEANTLAGLRKELSVSLAEHDSLERLLRGGRKRVRAVLAVPS